MSSTKKQQERGNAYLVPRFKKTRLKDITKKDWQKVIDDEFADKGLAKSTLKGIATTIKSFCKYASAKGYIADGDVPINFLIPAKATDSPKRSLYPQELQALLKIDSGKNWYIPVFQFMVYTGLRRGEVCALQAKRDYERPYITIRETISNELDIDSPKSGKERTEHLNSLALEAPDKHLEARKAKGFTKCKYLFCSVKGNRINPKVLSENWRKYRKEENLGEITLHELRHTFATYANKNLDIDALKILLGHSESMDTAGTYVHDVPLTEKEKEFKLKLDQEQAKKVEEIFKIILDS